MRPGARRHPRRRVLPSAVHRRRRHVDAVRPDRDHGAPTRHADDEARGARARSHERRPLDPRRQGIPVGDGGGVRDRGGLHAERDDVRAACHRPGLFDARVRLPARDERGAGRPVRAPDQLMDAAQASDAHDRARRRARGPRVRGAGVHQGGPRTAADGGHLDGRGDHRVSGDVGVRGGPRSRPRPRPLSRSAGHDVRLGRGRGSAGRDLGLPLQPDGALDRLRRGGVRVGGAGARRGTSAGADDRRRSVDVALHGPLITRVGFRRIHPRVSEGAALMQQVPALVELHADLLQPFAVRAGSLAAGFLLEQPVLFVREIVDVVQDVLVSCRAFCRHRDRLSGWLTKCQHRG